MNILATPFVSRQVAEMTTHAAKGLTENDFIMAAKVRALVWFDRWLDWLP